MSTIVTRSGKGSALTFTEMDNNFTNLNTDKLENIVEDTTPQLGGDLDVNGMAIVSVSNGNIEIDPNGTGVLILNGLNWPSADGTSGQVITTDGLGNLSFTSASGLANVVEDTTPQLGGDLDVQSFAITTSTVNGDITLTANGSGNIAISNNLDIGANAITTSTVNGDIDITPNGSGSVVIGGSSVTVPTTITNTTGNINISPLTANSVDLKTDSVILGEGVSSSEVVISATGDANLKIRGGNLGGVIMDDPVEFSGGDVDMTTRTITTGTTNANITVEPNGTGSLTVVGGTGIDLQVGSLFTTTTNANMTISANGTGYIALNQFGGVVVTNTGGSGFGVVTGETSVGLALLGNAGADTATDSGIKLTSGGGLLLRAGSGSTATISGNAVDITGTVTVNNASTLTGDSTLSSITNYAEKIETLAAVSGTLSIDSTAGPIKYVVPSGNITINGFSSPSAGETVTFLIDNATNATSFTLTLGAAILVPGGTAPSLTASGRDLLTISCIDPVTPVYIANVVNDFQ